MNERSNKNQLNPPPTNKKNDIRAFADLEKYLTECLNSNSFEDEMKGGEDDIDSAKVGLQEEEEPFLMERNRPKCLEALESPTCQKMTLEFSTVQGKPSASVRRGSFSSSFQVRAVRSNDRKKRKIREDFNLEERKSSPFIQSPRQHQLLQHDRKSSAATPLITSKIVPQTFSFLSKSCLVNVPDDGRQPTRQLRKSLNCPNNRPSRTLALDSFASTWSSPTLTQTKRLAAATKTSNLLLRKPKKKRSEDYFLTENTTSWSKWNGQDGVEDSNILDEQVRSFGPTFLSKVSQQLQLPIEDVRDAIPYDNSNNQSTINLDDGSSLRCNIADATLQPPRNKDSTTAMILNDTNSCSDSLMFGEQSSISLRQPNYKRRKNKGPFTKLLHSTRTCIEADCARFRSGCYPYRPVEIRKHDANDPRNRADNIMDITIIGHLSPFPSMENSMDIVLGFVHQCIENEFKIHTIRVPGRSRRLFHGSSSSVVQGEPNKSNNAENHSEIMIEKSPLQAPTRAWICLRSETCADLGIMNGSQIRIYNAHCIHSESTSYPVIVCTKLCEIYPSSDLSPLAGVPSR